MKHGTGTSTNSYICLAMRISQLASKPHQLRWHHYFWQTKITLIGLRVEGYFMTFAEGQLDGS